MIKAGIAIFSGPIYIIIKTKYTNGAKQMSCTSRVVHLYNVLLGSLYESSVELVRPSVHQVQRFSQSEQNFSRPNCNFIDTEYVYTYIMCQTFGLADL